MYNIYTNNYATQHEVRIIHIHTIIHILNIKQKRGSDETCHR